jgi:hypothetical protein
MEELSDDGPPDEEPRLDELLSCGSFLLPVELDPRSCASYPLSLSEPGSRSGLRLESLRPSDRDPLVDPLFEDPLFEDPCFEEPLIPSRWLFWRSAMFIPPYIVCLEPAHFSLVVSAGMHDPTSHAECQKKQEASS